MLIWRDTWGQPMEGLGKITKTLVRIAGPCSELKLGIFSNANEINHYPANSVYLY